jgi:methionine synthase II (cobalamin-independent)
MTHPWPAGAATGIGSLPGTDPVEAARLVFGELPALPHLPELPARGPGADMIGRGSGLLVDLPVELYAGAWRVAARPGRDLRRIADLWQRDLDALTESARDYQGVLKLQAAGPWTLAAGIDLPVGGAMLHDHGATREVAASLAAGLRDHVEDVRARVPGANVVLQLDEPSLPAVLAGRVPTESGLRTLRAVAADTVRSALASIVEFVGVPVVVHCCAAEVPISLLRTAGAAGVSLDTSLVGTPQLDQLGELIDAGGRIFAGAVPPVASGSGPTGTGSGSAAVATSVAASVSALWQRLGFAAELLPQRVVITPACGLAGASPDYARWALATCVDVARRLSDA